MPPGTVRDLVFVSYSHANPDWRDKLLVLLKPFVRQGQLQVWADPYIKTGDLWRRNIDEALASHPRRRRVAHARSARV